MYISYRPKVIVIVLVHTIYISLNVCVSTSSISTEVITTRFIQAVLDYPIHINVLFQEVTPSLCSIVIEYRNRINMVMKKIDIYVKSDKHTTTALDCYAHSHIS